MVYEIRLLYVGTKAREWNKSDWDCLFFALLFSPFLLLIRVSVLPLNWKNKSIWGGIKVRDAKGGMALHSGNIQVMREVILGGLESTLLICDVS